MHDDHCIRWLARLAASAAISAFLTACTTQSGGPAAVGGAGYAHGTPVYGLERGSRLAISISGDDREAIASAAGDLLASNQPGAVRPWTAGDGNSG